MRLRPLSCFFIRAGMRTAPSPLEDARVVSAAPMRRVGMPLAASVCLHAAVLLYLATRAPLPVLVTKPAPILIEFQETPAKVPEVKVEAPPPVVEAPKPQVKPKAVVRKVVVSSPPVVADVPPPPPVVDAPVVEDMPRAAPKLIPTLSLGSDGPSTSDFPVIVEKLNPTPEQLVQNMVSDTIARGKVDRGLVHPYYQQLGKTLLKSWDADRAVSANGLKGYLQQAKDNQAVWMKAWGDRAAEFAKTGSPLGKDEYLGPERPIVGDKDLHARRQIAMKMREQFKNTRRALIRVTQDSEGKLVAVELVQASNDPSVDKEAMKDVRTAAEKLPPPPKDAIGSRGRLVSIWQFELIISISPPVPSFSFEFDEALQFVDARLPLDRRIYKRVRLVSAE